MCPDVELEVAMRDDGLGRSKPPIDGRANNATFLLSSAAFPSRRLAMRSSYRIQDGEVSPLATAMLGILLRVR